MSGADEVGGGGVGVDGELDGFGAFLCGDAGGQAVLWVPVDGHSEGGGADGGIDDRLRREFEPIAVGFGEREAHVSARDTEHERDSLGRDELGGEDKVAFVFAVFVIGEDDHLAIAEVFEDFLDGGKGGGFGGGRSGHAAKDIAACRKKRADLLRVLPFAGSSHC